MKIVKPPSNSKQHPIYKRYWVTNNGDIWSSPKCGGKLEGLFLKIQQRKDTGHGYVGLRHDKQTHIEAVHRLVLETFVGPCPEGMECRHLDGDSANNKLSNLKWGTRSENLVDAVRHGTHQNIKLDKKDADFIRWAYSFDVFSQRKLAKLFSVAQSQIWKIVNNRRLGD